MENPIRNNFKDLAQAKALLISALEATDSTLNTKADSVELIDRLLDCQLAMETAVDAISHLDIKL